MNNKTFKEVMEESTQIGKIELTEAVGSEAKALADIMTRLFIGESGMALKGAQKALDAWKAKESIDYNGSDDYNREFDKLYTKFIKLIGSVN